MDFKVEFPEEEAGLCSSVQALSLVIPDNEYNQRVPLVVGTNIVRECKDRCEEVGGASFFAKVTHLIFIEKGLSICARASCEWPPKNFDKEPSINSGSP